VGDIVTDDCIKCLEAYNSIFIEILFIMYIIKNNK